MLTKIRSALEQVQLGDPSQLFDLLAEEVVWRVPSPANAPWYGTHRGKESFQKVILAGVVDFETFEVIDVFGSGDRYAALVHERYRPKATGKVVDQDVVFIFTIRDGNIVEYGEFVDTDQIRRAFEP